MVVITHDYLTFINNKYDISKLLDYILNRYNRMSFERVIACILQINNPSETILGDINTYSNKYAHLIGSIEDIPKYLNTELINDLPLIKIKLWR
jgi:hypothetical protein